MLPDRLSAIDDSNRGDHVFLTVEDVCFHYGEWAGKGYQGSPTNQLIFNYKTKPTAAAANPGRARYKQRAIDTVAATLRRTITSQEIEGITWVPIPTSKTPGHPDYDDRLTKTLKLAFHGCNLDIRELVRQAASTDADHSASNRQTMETLQANLVLDTSSLNNPIRSTLVLFDDVITTGKHYKCCETLLRTVVPNDVSICGLFVARRVIPNPFDGMDD